MEATIQKGKTKCVNCHKLIGLKYNRKLNNQGLYIHIKCPSNHYAAPKTRKGVFVKEVIDDVEIINIGEGRLFVRTFVNRFFFKDGDKVRMTLERKRI